MIFIVKYLKNRKFYIEMNQFTSAIFDIEKVRLKGPVLNRFFYCKWLNEFLQRLILICSPMTLYRISPSLYRRVETNDPLFRDRMAMDTSTRFHSNTHSLSLSLMNGQYYLKRTSVFQYTDDYVDERLWFKNHCFSILQKVPENSAIPKNVTWAKTSLVKARNLSIRPLFNLSCKWLLQSAHHCLFVLLTIAPSHPHFIEWDQWQTAIATKPPNSRIESTTLPSSIPR